MISLSCLAIGSPVCLVVDGGTTTNQDPGGPTTVDGWGRRLSAGMEISCPSVRTSLSAYVEYELSALTSLRGSGTGQQPAGPTAWKE